MTPQLQMTFSFFFNDTATTEIYTLSLHDALPISRIRFTRRCEAAAQYRRIYKARALPADRKSTRLNSSHQIISYAVFCLKKKKRAKPRESDSVPARAKATRGVQRVIPSVHCATSS